MKRTILLALLAAGGSALLQAQEAKTGGEDGQWADSVAHALPEAMVTGERPIVRVRAGALEYDLPRLIEGKPVDNIYDALKELPGVTEAGGSLSLGGRGVTVVLDGKTTTMGAEQFYALLKSMPASRIDRAEVMYNAPARYQTRGALINVRLKKRVGDPGTVTGEAYGKYDQQHEAAFQERAALLYNGSRLSLDFLYSHDHGKWYRTTGKEARHWQESDGSTHLIENRETAKGLSHSHKFRLGADYSAGGGHSLSFAYNGAYATGHGDTYTRGTQEASNRHTGDSWLHNGRVDYHAPFGLKAGAEFTWYRTPGTQLLASEMDGERLEFYSEDMQRINAWKFFLAQEHGLGGGWGLNYGASYTTTTDNSSQYYFEDEGKGKGEALPGDTQSRRRERTLNFYAGASKSFGEKLSADLSVAAERYETASRDEWDVYPAFSLTYMPSQSHVLQLSFGSDKSYPPYWAMQDMTEYMGGGYSEVQGNPSLKPSRSYNLQLAYVLRSKYMFVAWFNRAGDHFTQTLYQSPERLAEIYRYVNFDYQQQAGLQASVPFRAGKWLDSRVTLVGAYQRVKDSDFYDSPFDRRIAFGQAMWDNTVALSAKPDVKLTLQGFARSKYYQGLYDLPASGYVNIGLRYAFAGGGDCVLGAWCNDPFETSGIDPRIRYARQWVTNDYSCYRSAGLSFTWRFGGYKEKKREEVDTSRFK